MKELAEPGVNLESEDGFKPILAAVTSWSRDFLRMLTERGTDLKSDASFMAVDAVAIDKKCDVVKVPPQS